LFTRVVNHWVIVLGTAAEDSPGPDGRGEWKEAAKTRLLSWSMNRYVAKKPLTGKTLRRFGLFCLRRACHGESGFVNHARIVSNQFVPKRIFELAASRGADLKAR
jgi:hypothetical protein